MSDRWAVNVEANKRMCAGSTNPRLHLHGNRSPAAPRDALKSTASLETQDYTVVAELLPPPPMVNHSNTFQTTHALYHSSLRLWFRHLFLKHFWRTVFTLRAFLRCKDRCVWTHYEFWLGLLALWPPKPPNVPFSQGQPVARATGAIAMWGSFPAPFRRLHPDLTAPIVSDCWWQ